MTDPHDSMQESISARCHPPSLVLRGEIDAASIDRLEVAWTIVGPDGPHELDLSGVTFFSAAAVGRLVDWSHRRGPPLRVVASEPVLRLLDLCHLTEATLASHRIVTIVPATPSSPSATVVAGQV